ncbi:12126_t:CDS:2, partial [Funneliformis caledonium]
CKFGCNGKSGKRFDLYTSSLTSSQPDAMHQELYKGDYRFDKDGKHLKSYNADNRSAKGVSCFVSLEFPHNVPNESKKEIPCYFLPEGISLSESLALFYTHNIKLQFPSGEQTALHFVIAPTMHMTRENYEQAIRNGVEDFQMIEVYWLMEIWHEQTTCTMNRLHANDIYTWIALDKPSFQDLIMHEPRAYIVFSTLACMNARIPTSHVTELMYLGDILGELKDSFGWKAETSNRWSKQSGCEDIPKDVEKWDLQVIKFLGSELNLDVKYIKRNQRTRDK